MLPIRVIHFADEPTYGILARMAALYGVATVARFAKQYNLSPKIFPDRIDVDRIAAAVVADPQILARATPIAQPGNTIAYAGETSGNRIGLEHEGASARVAYGTMSQKAGAALSSARTTAHGGD